MANILLSPHKASRCQWEITHTSGEWNIGVKTYHGARKRGIFLLIHLKTGFAHLGYWNDSYLTVTCKHGTQGSTLRVKPNTATPAGKFHGELKQKELEFGLFLLPDMPQSRFIPFLIMCTNWSWNKNQQLNCEIIPKTKTALVMTELREVLVVGLWFGFGFLLASITMTWIRENLNLEDLSKELSHILLRHLGEIQTELGHVLIQFFEEGTIVSPFPRCRNWGFYSHSW